MPDILQVQDLRIVYEVAGGISQVVNGLNLNISEHHLVGLVGESGSGKTISASAMLGFVKKPGILKSGRVILDEKLDLLQLSNDKLNRYRGTDIALIAANARSHLNPLETVGDQIANVYRAHNKCSKKEAQAKTIEMLKAVGLTDPEQRAKAYPHELSGGMAQRCMIAMALINSPRVLIADDATNGLDVTVQAQIMDLILELIKTRGMSGLMITHDLGVVAQCCHDVAIMYCGQIVEMASVEDFFANPVHPYSRYLLNSLPEYRVAGDTSVKAGEGLLDSLNLPKGCLFNPRCRYANDSCRNAEPVMIEIEAGHFVKCCNVESIQHGGSRDE